MINIRVIFLAFLALTLSACVGGPSFQDRTAARVGAMTTMGERIADDTTRLNKASVCPPGMVSADEQYNKQRQAGTTYAESYGNQWSGGGNQWGSGYGRQWNGGWGAPQVNNPLPAGNTSNGTLNIYAGVQAQRSVTCVRPQSQR